MTTRPALVTLLAAAAALVPPALAPAPVAARCMSQSTEVWPTNGAPAPTNAVILIHGRGRVWQTYAPTQITLRRSGSSARVPLRVVVDSWAPAAQGMRTLVLAPAQPLAPNAQYAVSGYPAGMGTAARSRFRTGAGADTTAPTFTGATAQAFRSEEYGCGPAHEIPITVTGARDDRSPATEMYAHLRVARNAADLRAGRFAAEIVERLGDRATFQFGHGMCAGNFALEPGESWVASVTVADAAFQESAASPTVLRLDAR